MDAKMDKADMDTATPPAEVAEVRPGQELDWDALVAYLRANLPELGADFGVIQFPNGSANLTYLVQFGDQRLVSAALPSARSRPGAHDMRREYRTLSRLWRHFDKAPRAFFSVMIIRSWVGLRGDGIPVG